MSTDTPKPARDPKCFGFWLLAQYDRDDPIGDLAREFLQDPQAPSIVTPEDLEHRLLPVPVHPGLPLALLQAVDEWHTWRLDELERQHQKDRARFDARMEALEAKLALLESQARTA
jgi:hypothetical protein